MNKTKHRIGISSFTFPFACGVHPSQKPDKPFEPIDIILKAAEIGADCVQYGDNMPLEDYPDEYLKDLGEKALKLGITLEMGMREARTERLLKYIEIAKLTGAKLIRCILDKMAPHCVCLHVKDYKIHRANSGMGLIIVGECPGKGRQDIPSAIETAERLSGRDFNLILESWMEPCSTLEESLKQENEWAAEGVRYLKTLI